MTNLDAADATSDPSDPEVIRHEIEQTQSEIGRTVEALAAKTDVKEQVKEKAGDKAGQLRDLVRRRPAIAYAVGGLLLLLWLLRRRT